jgi:hypothetical protein
MDLNHSPGNSQEPLLAAWIKWTMDFWESMAQMGPTPLGPGGEAEAFWQSALKMWQSFFSLLTEPETVAAVFKGIRPPSEIILKMAQAGWAGYFHLHRQWLGEGNGRGEALGAYEFEDLDQDIFKICSEIYEKDFRQLLKLPQIGLTRLSQERTSRAMERFAQFQAAMAEFIYLVFLPLKKSLREIKLRDTGGNRPEEFKDYYRRWLRLLEGHYMSLFKSPEFTGNLSQTLNALEDFTLAKQELLADFLEILPVPTNRDMDELYQEVYFLKKQVKELSRKLARLTATPDSPEEL